MIAAQLLKLVPSVPEVGCLQMAKMSLWSLVMVAVLVIPIISIVMVQNCANLQQTLLGLVYHKIAILHQTTVDVLSKYLKQKRDTCMNSVNTSLEDEYMMQLNGLEAFLSPGDV